MRWTGRNRQAGRGRIALFIVLFAVAIPWYWRAAGFSPDARTWGMPTWFVVSVAGSFAISLVAAWQLRSPWPAEHPVAKGHREP